MGFHWNGALLESTNIPQGIFNQKHSMVLFSETETQFSNTYKHNLFWKTKTQKVPQVFENKANTTMFKRKSTNAIEKHATVPKHVDI